MLFLEAPQCAAVRRRNRRNVGRCSRAHLKAQKKPPSSSRTVSTIIGLAFRCWASAVLPQWRPSGFVWVSFFYTELQSAINEPQVSMTRPSPPRPDYGRSTQRGTSRLRIFQYWRSCYAAAASFIHSFIGRSRSLRPPENSAVEHFRPAVVSSSP